MTEPRQVDLADELADIHHPETLAALLAAQYPHLAAGRAQNAIGAYRTLGKLDLRQVTALANVNNWLCIRALIEHYGPEGTRQQPGPANVAVVVVKRFVEIREGLFPGVPIEEQIAALVAQVWPPEHHRNAAALAGLPSTTSCVTP